MKDYTNEKWREVLGYNNLATFDQLWNVDAGWFEKPNERRGGWSGVSRLPLQKPDGTIAHVFLKRQENHRRKLWSKPIRGVLTFEMEFWAINACKKAGTPTMVPVFFATRRHGDEDQAILVTEELAGYSSLRDIFKPWKKGVKPPFRERILLTRRIAEAIAPMHKHRLMHNGLHPKHILFKFNADKTDADIRLIDLEKTARLRTRQEARIRDFEIFNRRFFVSSRTDKMRFLLAYFGLKKSNKKVRKLWRRLG